HWWSRLPASPLAVVAWLLVVFEVASLTLGMINQYPAWSVGRSNLQALTGKTCGLADDVLVESDPNAGMLKPVNVPVADALGSASAEGFSPNGIPTDISTLIEPPASGNFIGVGAADSGNGGAAPEAATTGGTAIAAGVNGSRAPLPYGLDPATTPVLGSWRAGAQQPARLRSAWYRLPPRDTLGDDSAPLVVISAAGRFDQDEVTVQWATDEQAAAGKSGGSLGFADIGSVPAWRNLRAPLTAIPADATLIRVVAVDEDLSPQHWIAVTPPRIPKLRTLQQVVGSEDPVLLDWLVGLAFPCQRPFGHSNGVTEVPRWRILPDRFGTDSNSPVMDNIGGGPLGISELLFRATTVPTYLKNDWFRDWGSLQRLMLYYPDATPARLELGTATRSGWWSPAPLRPT
ncbi:MAG: arabinosyltransferase C-terminal domain-containing protein, partial [Mycobacteriaceae bacterium]